MINWKESFVKQNRISMAKLKKTLSGLSDSDRFILIDEKKKQ
jgi:hypothetical protein